MPEIWGPDFEEFHPERWLDKENEGQLSESKHFDLASCDGELTNDSVERIFFAFGGGSRTCIGRSEWNFVPR